MDDTVLKKSIVLLLIGAVSFSVSYSWMKFLDALICRFIPSEENLLTHRIIHTIVMTLIGLIAVYSLRAYIYDEK